MPRSVVFVADEKMLDVSIGAAQLRLGKLVHSGWMHAASQAAYQGGIDHLIRVGPFGDVPGTSRLVRVRFVDPVYRDGAMSLGVRWEAVGVSGGLFPVLDANIRLSEESDQGTRVALTASYRPLLGPVGAQLDRVLMHRVATATIRTFLARVAAALEGNPEGAEETAAPFWWEPGPEPAPG
jgi:hypothetical protein